MTVRGTVTGIGGGPGGTEIETLRGRIVAALAARWPARRQRTGDGITSEAAPDTSEPRPSRHVLFIR